MADIPLEIAAPAVAVLTGAVGTLFGLLIRSKSSEAKAWKAAWKDVVASRRQIRRDIEAAELGAPSVPPAADEDYDDRTGRFDAVDDEDRNWRPPDRTRIDPGQPRRPPLEAFEDRLSQDERLRNERDRALRKFLATDGESTPPNPARIAYRNKLPSRKG